jgi:hypothetical protein
MPQAAITPKPKDVTSAAFAPVAHDRVVEHEVLAFNRAGDDVVAASITVGAPFFRASQVAVTNLTLQESDPGEVHGHPDPVRFWSESSPVAISDGATPLSITADQRLHVSVALDIPEHRLPPGPIRGTLLVRGSGLSRKRRVARCLPCGQPGQPYWTAMARHGP